MNNNITRENIVANAAKYDIKDIEGLCSRVCGLMAYNETTDEYNFLCETAYGDTNIDELPICYLPNAAKQIMEVLWGSNLCHCSSEEE